MNFIVLIVCLFFNFSDGSVINCENGCLDRPIMLSSKGIFKFKIYTLATEPKLNGTQFTLERSGSQARIVNINLNDTKSSLTIVGQCDFANSLVDGFIISNKQKYLLSPPLDKKSKSIGNDRCSWLLPLNVTNPITKNQYPTRNATYWMQVVADGEIVLEDKDFSLSFAPSTLGNLLMTLFMILLSWVIS